MHMGSISRIMLLVAGNMKPRFHLGAQGPVQQRRFCRKTNMAVSAKKRKYIRALAMCKGCCRLSNEVRGHYQVTMARLLKTPIYAHSIHTHSLRAFLSRQYHLHRIAAAGGSGTFSPAWARQSALSQAVRRAWWQAARSSHRQVPDQAVVRLRRLARLTTKLNPLWA